jgi:hypothetical protein
MFFNIHLNIIVLKIYINIFNVFKKNNGIRGHMWLLIAGLDPSSNAEFINEVH